MIALTVLSLPKIATITLIMQNFIWIVLNNVWIMIYFLLTISLRLFRSRYFCLATLKNVPLLIFEWGQLLQSVYYNYQHFPTQHDILPQTKGEVNMASLGTCNRVKNFASSFELRRSLPIMFLWLSATAIYRKLCH